MTFIASNKGVVTFSVTPKVSGTQSIQVADTAQSALTGSLSLKINAAAASRLAFGGNFPASAVTATAMPAFDVLVQDAFGNLTTSTATITLSQTSGGGSLSGTLTRTAVNGSAAYTDINNNGNGTIRLAATSPGLAQADSSLLEIASSGFHHFVIVSPVTKVAVGTPTLSHTIKAVDANGQVVTSYNGTIHFSSSDATATLPLNTIFTEFDNGVININSSITFNNVGLYTFTVVDTVLSSSSTTSSTFNVVSSLSKSVSPLADSTGPSYASILLFPKKINLDNPPDALLLNLNIHELDDPNGVQRMEFSVSSGLVKIFEETKRQLGPNISSTWNCRKKSGQLCDNGVYEVCIQLYDNFGNATTYKENIELESNIDIGRFGP